MRPGLRQQLDQADLQSGGTGAGHLDDLRLQGLSRRQRLEEIACRTLHPGRQGGQCRADLQMHVLVAPASYRPRRRYMENPDPGPEPASQRPMDDALPPWYVRQRGLVRGPFDSAHIRRLLNDDELSPMAEVSQDGEQWLPVMAVPEVLPPRFRQQTSSAPGPALPVGDVSERERQWRSDRRRGLRVSGGLALGVLIAIAVTHWLGQGREIPADSQCDVNPGPGVQWRNCRLDGLQAVAADLRGLSGLNLSMRGARLERARLARADLRYADLDASGLGYADLSGADLLGANLRGADLIYADLRGANLAFSNLKDARIGGAVLRDARLSGAIWIDGRRCAEPSIGVCD